MKTIAKNITVLALATIGAALTLVGCQDPDYPAPNVTVTGPAISTARALFVNASPNSPALNFLVENVVAAQSLALGQNSNYVSIPVGNIQLRAKAASGSIGGTLGSSDILYRAGTTNQNNFASTVNTNYSIFVTDTIQRPAPTTPAGVTNPGGPQFLFVTDNLTAPASGTANVRFLNLAPDTQALSLRLQPVVPASTTATPAFAGRSFRVTSVTSGTVTTNYANFTPVVAGTYRADVFAGATVPTSTTASPVASTTVNLTSTKIYTMYTQGLIRNRSLGVGVAQHN